MSRFVNSVLGVEGVVLTVGRSRERDGVRGGFAGVLILAWSSMWG